MKNYGAFLLGIIFSLFTSQVKGQSYGLAVNPLFIAQVTANQGVRSVSQKLFLDSYSKQKELYDDIYKKAGRVMAIHEYIYGQLVNVNSLFKQGRSIGYMAKDIEKIYKECNKLLQLARKKPHYMLFTFRIITEVKGYSIEIYQFFKNEIQKGDAKRFMDSYERDRIIYELRSKVKKILYSLMLINQKLESNEKLLFISDISPDLSSYVTQDKYLIKSIIEQYKFFTK